MSSSWTSSDDTLKDAADADADAAETDVPAEIPDTVEYPPVDVFLETIDGAEAMSAAAFIAAFLFLASIRACRAVVRSLLSLDTTESPPLLAGDVVVFLALACRALLRSLPLSLDTTESPPLLVGDVVFLAPPRVFPRGTVLRDLLSLDTAESPPLLVGDAPPLRVGDVGFLAPPRVFPFTAPTRFVPSSLPLLPFLLCCLLLLADVIFNLEGSKGSVVSTPGGASAVVTTVGSDVGTVLW